VLGAHSCSGRAGGGAVSETSFGAQLRRLAAAAPARAALTCEDRTLTRAELTERTDRLAAYFAGLGVGVGSTVTIGLPNSIEFVESMIATWLLGAVPQPISHRLPSAERAAIIELADPALVVGVNAAEAGGRPNLERVPDNLPPTSQVIEPSVSPVWKILTSGGSTGRPKLIMAVQPALVENMVGLAELLRFPTDGGVLVTGPMSHNAPFIVAILGLLRGNHVVVMPRFDATETLQLVERHRVQWLYLVPTMMLRIWRLPEAERLGRDLSSLEIAFHMAAPCPPWLKEAWIDWLGPDVVFELYGGTELQAMTVITGREWLEHRGSVGRPVIGEMEVRADDGRQVTPLEVGEIWMRRGPDLPVPYRYVGATAKTAAGAWESLGDLGYLDDEGFVYLTDRDADMILVGGANVYPAEVEAALDEYPAMRSSCVIGLPHEDLGSVPHALVELSEPTSDDALFAHLRDRLAAYKLPRSIERVDEPLRDDAGKVRRSALRTARLTKP
jgi:bile acid-coenzyme A ligase